MHVSGMPLVPCVGMTVCESESIPRSCAGASHGKVRMTAKECLDLAKCSWITNVHGVFHVSC